MERHYAQLDIVRPFESHQWSPRKFHDKSWIFTATDLQAWSQSLFRKISFEDLERLAVDCPNEQINAAYDFIRLHKRSCTIIFLLVQAKEIFTHLLRGYVIATGSLYLKLT